MESSPPSQSELARRVAQRLYEHEGTGRAWGLRILDAGPGQARVAMTITDAMLNGYGSGHGGMIFALADTAFAYACNSRNCVTVGQAASIVYLAPVQPGETLVAHAREIAVSGRSGVYEVIVATEGSDRVVATFQGQSRALGGQIVDIGSPAEQGHPDHA